MTTIAWDGKSIAADGLMTGDYIEQYSVNKLKVKGGNTIAGAGDTAEINKFASDITVSIGVSSSALVVNNKTGRCNYYSSTGDPIPMKKMTAIGSGGAMAMAAMLAGANAKEAVKIACKLDPYSGGRITTKKFK